MTRNAKHIGRVGALAVALGVGIATGAPASVADVPPKTTALVMCGTTCPTPNNYVVETVGNQYIAPTHPGDIEYVKVTTPEELWPVTGALRLLELALGPPELGGLGGPAWPDEPLWKLSGLFDLSADKSVQAGADNLEAAIAAHPNDHVVIFGYSQGAGVANVTKRKLAEQYPGPAAPDIDFVLLGDPNLPNGGLMSRFAGLHIPILDFSFNGPALTDTKFDTVEVSRKYDGFTDFPLYPLNFVADANALLGTIYVHMYLLDVSLPAGDPTESPAYQGKHGDTSYYVFDNPDLPLFGPLRTLGVPEPVIDVFEPFFKVIVEQGYDRSIKPWEPTPARLIPKFEPAKLATDLVNAVGEGIDNAGALVKPQASLKQTAVSTNTAVDEDVQDVELQTNETVGAVQSVGEGHTSVKSIDRGNNATPFKAGHAGATPLRDAVKTLSSGVKKVVDKVSDNIKKAMTAGGKPQSSTGD
jgi:hypothetical protein